MLAKWKAHQNIIDLFIELLNENCVTLIFSGTSKQVNNEEGVIWPSCLD